MASALSQIHVGLEFRDTQSRVGGFPGTEYEIASMGSGGVMGGGVWGGGGRRPETSVVSTSSITSKRDHLVTKLP